MTDRNCRFCAAELTRSFVDLGRSALANSFLGANEVLLTLGAVMRNLGPLPPALLRQRAAGTVAARQLQEVLVPQRKTPIIKEACGCRAAA
jgi:hypothetical protein